MKRQLLAILMLAVSLVVLLAACEGDATQVAQVIPTNTLAPIVSMTPRFTATLIPTRTPSPTMTHTETDTPIPSSPTNTFTPTATPPILGSVYSVQAVNVRSGPGVNFDAVAALPPGTGFQVLGTNGDGAWFNIRMENGDEGWISSSLVRLQPTETPLPSLTPTPNLTLLAQGTPLPTSIFGGGTITPTPPRSVVTPTAIGSIVPLIAVASSTAGGGIQLPNIEAINQTATALVGGVVLPTAQPTNLAGGPTGGPLITGTATQPPVGAGTTVPVNPQSRQGVDVLAYCDNTIFGEPPPNDLAVGSTIDVWWRWVASTRQQVQDHIDNAIYDVRLDGVQLTNWRQYNTGIRELGGQWAVDWLVPSAPLLSGSHTITYSVTWRAAIFDGIQQYGPGTNTPRETGTCTFTVR